ncbi:MAG: PQQ-binding-like beta-propeller repeat protein [Melioribacteraceae bacterium]|nr:PQQ-binding-like beta-propeller repeat protein [Melioribacteraceae bacterium]MCF8396490.1 PQQ-binding-like beta-propeller repeat protein [Melioribacteraceae bacterium]
MKKILTIIITIAISFLLIQSCKDKGTEPQPEPKPPGYQEDILWPSLADSPWPMNHHDPQSTGRSKFRGPISGNSIQYINLGSMESNPVIGIDSVILIAVSNDTNNFKSYDYNGNLKWSLDIEGRKVISTPLLTSRGNAIVSNSTLGKIYSISISGRKINWEYKTESGLSLASPSIDKSGNLYFITNDSRLLVINQDGELLWEYFDSRILGGSTVSPTFSPDGDVLYVQGNVVSVIAIDIFSRSVKWTFGNTRLFNSPSVDSQGNLYVLSNTDTLGTGKSYFYSLSATGEIRWRYRHSHRNTFANCTPTIDKNGNIYFAITDTLYSLDYNGELRWKKQLYGGGWNLNNLINDIDGRIYVGVSNDLFNSRILCYTNEGALLWQSEAVVDERALGISPCLNENQELIYPTFRSNSLLIISGG